MQNYFSFLKYINTDSFFLLAFSVFSIIFIVTILWDLRISKIEKNIEKGELIKEYDLEGTIVSKKTKMFHTCKTIKIENILQVAFNINAKTKIIKVVDSNIYDNFKEDDKCVFQAKEIKYKNKKYTYIQLKDNAISNNKTFLKSIEHKLSDIGLSIVLIILFNLIACQILQAILLMF